MPGDITAMQAMLAKYAAATFDVVGRLPTALGAKVLAELEIGDLLRARHVSKTWLNMCVSEQTPLLDAS